jgi:hypothetical protein
MSKWKPIEDKTGMKYRTYVLVYTKFDYGYNRTHVSFVYGDMEKGLRLEPDLDKAVITHWRQMPKPPKKDKK